MEKKVLIAILASWTLKCTSKAQFVPGFLVESGSDLQEWPQDLSKLFPQEVSPQEHRDQIANIQALQHGAIAAPLPESNPVEAVLGAPIDPRHPEYQGLKLLANGTAVPYQRLSENDGGEDNDGVADGDGDDKCRLVAFSVSKAHHKHRKAGTRGVQVLFDKVLASEGPGFNHTGGTSHATVQALIFRYTWSVSPPRLDLMRNRERVTSSEAQYYGFGTASNSAIIRLDKNDIVYVFLAEGYLYENDVVFKGYASFTGFKIG